MVPALVVFGGPTEFASRLILGAVVAVGLSDILSVRAFGGGKTDETRDRRTFEVIQALQLVAVLGALLAASRLAALALPGNPYAWVVPGLALMAAGAAFRAWAVASLGRRFRRVVAIDADHEIVTAGPYRWLRHPAYTGALVTFVGLGLALDNAVAVALCAFLPIWGYLYRIRVEERELELALGEPYRAFAVGRKRLIPGVW